MEPPFIHRRGDHLAETVRGQAATSLLAQKPSLEVSRHDLPSETPLEISSPENPEDGEVFYLVSGRLHYRDEDVDVALDPGDCIAAHEVLDTAYFETAGETTLLQITSRPSFSLTEKTNRRFYQMAEKVEADEHMEGHSKRLETMAKRIGQRLGITGESLFLLSYAAYFHDIGKAKVPDRIIQKPVSLTDEEWAVMKRHSEWGRELLAEERAFAEVGRIVEQIHERVDGGGYPHGLRGDEIRLEAKIVAVVDAYDAMTTDRPYRKGMPHDTAIEELQANAGTQFDSDVVAAFVAEFGGRPPTEEPTASEDDLTRWSQTESFLELGERILAGQDLEELLDDVVTSITEHTPFQRAALALYDRPISPDTIEQVRIKHTAQSGLTPEEEAQLQANPLPPQERKKIFRAEFRLNRSYYVPADRNPWGQWAGFVRGQVEGDEGNWHPEDMLFVPMWVPEDRLIGLISVDDPSDSRAPTPKAIEPLELFANLAALAIQKAQDIETLEDFQRRLQGVYRLSESLVQLDDLDKLMTHAGQIIREHFKYDYICLLVREGEFLELRGFECRFPEEEINYDLVRSIPLGHGVAGWVAQANEPALISDVRSDPRFIPGHESMRSELAVPMAEGDKVLGVVNIESAQIDAFSQQDLALLKALARQLAVAISNIRQRRELHQSLQQQEWTSHFLQSLNQAENLESLLRMVLEHAIDRLRPKADAGNVLLYNDQTDRFEFYVAVNRDWERLKQSSYQREELLQVFSPERPIILTRSRQLQSPVTRKPADESGTPIPGSTLCIPIHDPEADQLLAFLNLNNLEHEDVFTEADAAQLEPLIPESTAALTRARDRERLERQAIHDPLTGVYNRHYFAEYVATETARAQRSGHPISLLLIDFDHFHKVNDRCGHLEGDRVLRETAQLFQQHARTADTVVRYGGDEFLILMPEIDRQGAEQAADRIRRKLARADLDLPDDVTISVGIATWSPEEHHSFDAVLEEADRWMYQRKREKDSNRD